MGSLKALQEWCRIQCEHYNEVEIKNMSTSFRDGLAFCAIIHRFRPDLIEFSSLSKENVYENNRMAFEVAETQLGIPALLDPEDMVSMKVPDRLSIITYVSQYYNFFTNKSQVNPPCMKRPASAGQREPAQKRPMGPLGDQVVESELSRPVQTGVEADVALKRSTLSSTCTVCLKHVHLVQRFLVDGKLYHRNCFRCRECCSTLLPGSYKAGTESGSLICTHHFTRPALANQNGRPDLSKPPLEVQSARIGPVTSNQAQPSESDQEMPLPPVVITVDRSVPTSNSVADTPALTTKTDTLIEEKDGSGEEQDKGPAAPPNPFDDSDDEGENEEEQGEIRTPTKETSHGDKPQTPLGQPESINRPVPAPRRVPESTPPPRPAPRARPPHATDSHAVNGERQKPLLPPKPRERSRSPGSLSNDTPKTKDPPWLALVQSESKKKPAPPPPPAGLATPPHAGSLSSLKGEGTRPATPPPNPFDVEEDDDDGNDEEGEERQEEGLIPAPVVAGHPWYSITHAAEPTGADTPPSGGCSSRSASPDVSKRKKRPAPRAPHTPSANQAFSTESLSSGSDHSASQAHYRGPVDVNKEQHPFTKSVSEPYICGPCDATTSPASSSAERLRSRSPSPFPPSAPGNTSSAPATPQTSRSSGAKGPKHPPPRPPTTPSPLASAAQLSNNKRICKENPFNRKPSSSHGNAKARAPKGPRPARPPAPGHGFPLIKRKVQSDQYIPAEDIHGEMSQLEKQLDELEQRGVELETKLRDNPNDEEEERLLVEWFTLIHDKNLLVRREAELVYTAKQQNLEERQADVEYELRCLLNKPEKEWSKEDRSREQELMVDLVTIIEQRNQIINNMDQDRQREEEEDKLMAAMLKTKDFHKDPDTEEKKKKGAKFKPMKVLKRLSHKGEPVKGQSPRKEKN